MPSSAATAVSAAAPSANRILLPKAQMILSCVLRIHKQLGYYVGYTLVVRTLSGSREQRVQSLSLDKLSTYGLLRQYSRAKIRTFIDELVRQGYLQIQSAHQTLEPTERSRAVLFENAQVTMFVRFEIAPQRSTPISPHRKWERVSPALLLALKSERARIAQEEHSALYCFFQRCADSDGRAGPTAQRNFFLSAAWARKRPPVMEPPFFPSLHLMRKRSRNRHEKRIVSAI